MVSFGGIVQSLISNWVTIVVTTLATGVTLYVSRSYQTSAREERLNQAKESVVTVVEEHVIDGKKLTLGKFDDLINASERRHSVPLSKEVTKISLLEDLELKIEQSPHLNSEQKQEYTTRIQEYISEIEEKESAPKVSKTYEEIVQSLSKKIEEGEDDDALEELENLEEKISKLESKSSTQVSTSPPEIRVFQLMTVMLMFAIWYFVFSEVAQLTTLSVNNFGIVVTLIVFITIYFKTTGGY